MAGQTMTLLISLSKFVLLALLTQSGLAEEVVNCNNVSNNLGTCECDPQIFVDNDCKSAFYCNSANAGTNSEGCTLECTGDNEYILYDAASETVSCIESTSFICPGFFQYDCLDNLPDSSFFPDDVWCDCPQQFWVNGDCTSAYMCTERNVAGFRFDCTDEDTKVQVQPANREVSCLDTVNSGLNYQCHGPYHYGCPRDNPNFGPDVVCSDNLVNTLGTCECSPQAFISDDCKTAFLCSDQYAGENSEGCILECTGENEHISYDPETQSLSCTTAAHYTCPNAFEYDCRENLRNPTFFPDDIECGCAGQIWVNGDCSQFHVCSDTATQASGPTPGYTVECDGNNKAIVNVAGGAIQCVDPDTTPADYKCFGPYHFGCASEDQGPTSEAVCTEGMTNPFGECACDPQVFISNNCKTAFICSETYAFGSSEGCMLECTGSDEYVFYDQETGELGCRETPPGYTCPGDFQYDCSESLDNPSDFPAYVTCECSGQFWMNGDCSQSFLCYAVSSENIPFPAYTYTCPAESNSMQLQGAIGRAGFFNCLNTETTNLDYKCHGPYHMGC